VWLTDIGRRLRGRPGAPPGPGSTAASGRPAARVTLLALAGGAPGAPDAPGATDGAALAALQALGAALERNGYAARLTHKRRADALRKAARAAAAAGEALVVVAGGERAAAAAARGLAGRATPLYVLPEVATGGPRLALPAPADATAVSLGRTDARGERRGRLFWQRATAGPADPFKPVEVVVRLDGTAFWHGPAAAVEVRNLALPGTSPDLAALEVGVLPAAAGGAGGAGSPAPPAMRARAATVEVRARGRLPVRADGKLVGTTPATFRALPAALRLVPAAPLPVAAPARAIVLRPPALPAPAAGGPAGRAALAVAGKSALLRRLRPLAVPLASAAGGAVLGVLIAPLLGRLCRRPE
jgi:hypothetical protein